MEIRIGDRLVGNGHPAFIIAELGYNFNSLEEGIVAVDAAAEAGADAIKLQTFRADTLVTRDVDFPPEAGGGNQHAEFRRYEISEETHRKIFERARQKGIIPFSTPSHMSDADMLERLGIEIYKIGSDDLTNLPYIEYVAKKEKPVIFSSGMATLSEVDEAVRTFLAAGNSRIVLLQCTSNYPIKDRSWVNLRVIESYKKSFPCLVGFSDHTTGVVAAVAAVALGACVIEKHFTPDKNNGAPDSFFSADPEEMKSLVSAVREAEAMLGNGVKNPTPSEVDMRKYTRKSLVARRDIPQGKKLCLEDLVVKRPATGIPPREIAKAVGRSARKDIRADEVITWECL